MTIYDFKCKCGYKDTRNISYKKLHEQVCECGQVLNQDWANKRIAVDVTCGYYDPQLGAYIGSSSDRRREEKKAGVYAISANENVRDVVKPKKRTINTTKIRSMVESAVNKVDNGFRVPKQAIA